MFGYIRPDESELKVKEHLTYKAAYCGLCQTIKKRYPFFIRLSLSYDFVYYVLLSLYLNDEKASFSKKRCIAHPSKKKTMMDENNALNNAADCGVLLLYYNTFDKIKDNDKKKKFLAKLFLPFARKAYKNAIKNEELKLLDEKIRSSLENLEKIEKENTNSLDIPSDEFGYVMKEILSFGIYDEKCRRIAGQIGFFIGKWVYTADAFDDLEKDEKNKDYNPFLSLFGTSDEVILHSDEIKTAERKYADESIKALILQNNGDTGIYNILKNIQSFGMSRTIDNIIRSKKQ